MVHFVQLDDKTFVTGQISPQDVPELAAGGIKVIVNNRPDGEAPGDQPLASELEAAAIAQGIAFVNLPFTAPTLTPDYAAKFAELLKKTDGPILAFCRTGNRSTMLWAAATLALGAPLDAVLEQAGRAGYDLRPAAAFLQALGDAASAE
jgi:uncharacterized protein (TIGR01244 family)